MASGFELGFKIEEYLSNKLAVEAGASFVIPKVRIQGGPNRPCPKLAAATIRYDIFRRGKLELNAQISLYANLRNVYNPNPWLMYGLGATYRLASDVELKGQLATGMGLCANVGICKKLNIFSSGGGGAEGIKVDLNISRKANQYSFPDPRYKDINKHWAGYAINDLSKKGFISKKGKRIFQPNAPISRIDALKMVVMAAEYHNILKESRINFDYTLDSAPDTYSYVNIKVTDEEGTEDVKYVLSGQETKDGTFNKYWDGTDKKDKKVASGKYKVHFDIEQNGKKVFGKNEIVEINKEPELVVKTLTPRVVFKDISKSYKDKQYIDKAIDMGLLEILNMGRPMQATSRARYEENFYPDKEMNKIEFIVLIGKALYYLGADTKILADLSFYRDEWDIGRSSRIFLDIYLNEFGYIGDNEQQLNPNKFITRAEAVVITERFMKWKEARLNKGYRFEERLPRLAVNKVLVGIIKAKGNDVVKMKSAVKKKTVAKKIVKAKKTRTKKRVTKRKVRKKAPRKTTSKKKQNASRYKKLMKWGKKIF
jgi:hypothetical protein